MEHGDLVAYALKQLDAPERGRVELDLDADPAARRELADIEGHLTLHDALPRLEPPPELWRSLEARLEAPVRRPFRFWMPVAAAALVAAALVLPGTAPAPRTVHGALRPSDGGWKSVGVSRAVLGDGVTVTTNPGAEIVLLDPQRLALRAGRAFFQVEPSRRGFAVVAGGMTATTTGTAFLVETREDAAYVYVESGEVTCRADGAEVVAAAGDLVRRDAHGLRKADPAREAVTLRDWFTRPSFEARIEGGRNLRILFRNDMPDPIEMAPPTGGEPLFHATVDGRNVPVEAALAGGRLRLAPGEGAELNARLARPAPEGADVWVFCRVPPLKTRAEEAR